MAGLLSRIIGRGLPAPRGRGVSLTDDALEGSVEGLLPVPFRPQQARPQAPPIDAEFSVVQPRGVTNGQKAALGAAGAAGLAGTALLDGGQDQPPEDPAQAAIDAAIQQKQQIADQQGLTLEDVDANFFDSVAQGAEGEDKSFLEQLDGEFDMMTVGLHLLAAAGSNEGFGVKMGKALIAGKRAKTGKAEKARTAVLEERKVVATEKTADAALKRAAAAAFTALNKGNTISVKEPTRTEQTVAQSILGTVTDFDLSNDPEKTPGQALLISNTARVLKIADEERKRDRLPPLTPPERTQIVQSYLDTLQDPSGAGVLTPGTLFGQNFNPEALLPQQLTPAQQRIAQLRAQQQR